MKIYSGNNSVLCKIIPLRTQSDHAKYIRYSSPNHIWKRRVSRLHLWQCSYPIMGHMIKQCKQVFVWSQYLLYDYSMFLLIIYLLCSYLRPSIFVHYYNIFTTIMQILWLTPRQTVLYIRIGGSKILTVQPVNASVFSCGFWKSDVVSIAFCTHYIHTVIFQDYCRVELYRFS